MIFDYLRDSEARGLVSLPESCLGQGIADVVARTYAYDLRMFNATPGKRDVHAGIARV